jgi:hypothetical protein
LTIVNLEFWAFFPSPFLWIYSSGGGVYPHIFYYNSFQNLFSNIPPSRGKTPEEKSLKLQLNSRGKNHNSG